MYAVDMGNKKTQSLRVRCSGITKRNQRCKLWTHNADGYCGKHRDKHHNSPTPPAEPCDIHELIAARHTPDAQIQLLTGELLDLLDRQESARDEIRDLVLSCSERKKTWEANPPIRYGDVIDEADSWYDSVDQHLYEQQHTKATNRAAEAASDLKDVVIQHMDRGPKEKRCAICCGCLI